MTYENFYEYIWGRYVSESDVSFEYRKENQEFIRLLTFSLYQKYSSKNVHESVYAEAVKSFFNCLFLYKPNTFDIIS